MFSATIIGGNNGISKYGQVHHGPFVEPWFQPANLGRSIKNRYQSIYHILCFKFMEWKPSMSPFLAALLQIPDRANQNKRCFPSSWLPIGVSWNALT